MGYDRKSRSFLIDTIWPEFGLHVMSGGSGTWKTSLLFTMLREFQENRPVFGLSTNARPWVYIAFDRDLNETWDTLDMLKYDPPTSQIFSSYDNFPYQQNMTGVIQAMPKLLPHGGLMCIDGLQILNPNDNNSYAGVASFTRMMRTNAAKHNVTLLGTVHNAKAKQGEEYAHPRDKIMGSVAWGATVGTIMALEKKDELDVMLTICPRTSKEYKIMLTRDAAGQIVPRDEAEETEGNLVLNARLAEVPAGAEIKRSDIMAWALDANISERTAERWLTRQSGRSGRLQRTGRGVYQKMHEN